LPETRFITKNKIVIPIRNKGSGLSSAKLGLVNKRRVNRTKRVKLNSHGFKVPKNTKFYIGKATEGQAWKGTEGKPEFSPELVDIFREMWNKDPSMKMLRKHVKDFSMVYAKTPTRGGVWFSEKKKVKLYDYPEQTPEHFKHTVVHELIGHTFWDLARKYRREPLVEFNELASSLPPVNEYVKKNEEQWKKWNDEDHEDFKALDRRFGLDPDDENASYEWLPEDKQKEYLDEYNKVNENRKTNGYASMTRYANEQHSAITEIVYDDKAENHRWTSSESDRNKLIEAWKKLHY